MRKQVLILFLGVLLGLSCSHLEQAEDSNKEEPYAYAGKDKVHVKIFTATPQGCQTTDGCRDRGPDYDLLFKEKIDACNAIGGTRYPIVGELGQSCPERCINDEVYCSKPYDIVKTESIEAYLGQVKNKIVVYSSRPKGCAVADCYYDQVLYEGIVQACESVGKRFVLFGSEKSSCPESCTSKVYCSKPYDIPE